jgi:hypothetical protein
VPLLHQAINWLIKKKKLINKEEKKLINKEEKKID